MNRKIFLLFLIVFSLILLSIPTQEDIKHTTTIKPLGIIDWTQKWSDKKLNPGYTDIVSCSRDGLVIRYPSVDYYWYNFSSGDYFKFVLKGDNTHGFTVMHRFASNDTFAECIVLNSGISWSNGYIYGYIDDIKRIEISYSSGSATYTNKYVPFDPKVGKFNANPQQYSYSGSYSLHKIHYIYSIGSITVTATFKVTRGSGYVGIVIDTNGLSEIRYSYMDNGGNPPPPPPSKKYVLNVKSKPINVKISYEIDGKSYSKTTPFSIKRDRPFTVKLTAPQYYSGYSFSYWDADHIYTSRTITLNISRSMTATAVYYKQNSPPKYLLYIRSNPISGVRYLYANPTYPWQNPGWKIGYTPDSVRPGENRWKDVWVKLSVPLYWYSNNEWYKFKNWTIYTGVWTVWKTYTNVNITFNMKGHSRLIAYAYYDIAETHRLTLKIMYLDYLDQLVDIVKNYPVEIDGTTYYTNSTGYVSIATHNGNHKIYVYDKNEGNTYYYFYKYSDNNRDNPRTITLDRDKMYTIYLIRQDKVKITYTEGGNVFLNSELIDNGTERWYRYGSPIALEAVPGIGHSFNKWLLNNNYYSNNKFILWQVFNPAEWKAVFVKKQVKLTYLGSNWYLMHEGINISFPYSGYYNISVIRFYSNSTPVYHLLTDPNDFHDIYYSGNLTIYAPTAWIPRGKIVKLPNPSVPRVSGGMFNGYYWLGCMVGNPFNFSDISGFNNVKNITYNIYNISLVFYNSTYQEEFRQTIVISAYNLSLHAYYDRYGVNVTLITEWRYRPPLDNFETNYHKVDVAIVAWDKHNKILFKKTIGDEVRDNKLYTYIYLLHQDLTDRYWTNGSELVIEYRWLSPSGRSLQFRPYGSSILETQLICMIPYVIGNVSENPVIVHYWINPWLINRVKVIAVLWDNREYSWTFNTNDFTITINVDKRFKDIYWYFIPSDDTRNFILYVPPIKW